MSRNEYICRLAQNFQSYINLEQIGELFGITKERVRQILKQNGVRKESRRGRYRTIDDASVCELVSQNLTSQEIADKLDCSRATVHATLRRNNLRALDGRIKHPQLHDEDWMRRNVHRTLRDIALELGCYDSAIARARARFGIKTGYGHNNSDGRQIKYPKLYDEEWVRANHHRTSRDIALELDCYPKYVIEAWKRFGLRKMKKQ